MCSKHDSECHPQQDHTWNNEAHRMNDVFRGHELRSSHNHIELLDQPQQHYTQNEHMLQSTGHIPGTTTSQPGVR